MRDRQRLGPEVDPRRLLRAQGAERDRLLSELFGDISSTAGPALRLTPGGLLVPDDATPALDPLDRMFAYLTTEEILGPGEIVPFRVVVENVGQMSLERALAWCATWIARLHDPRRSQQDVDAEFISTHLAGSQRAKIENLLRNPEMILLATQTFVVIAKIALERCARRGEPPSEEDLRPLVTAALILPSYLTADVEDVSEDDHDALAVHLVANQLFNEASNWKTAWAIFQRCFRELPHELREHARVVDFEAAYLDATGVELDDLAAVGAIIWAHAVGEGPSFPLSYFDSLGWEPERLENVLAFLCATPEALADMLREDAPELGFLWSTNTFDRYPVIRWDSHLTVLHPGWVVKRCTGMWPLLDVRRELAQRDGASRASVVATSVEYVHEHFALDVITDIVGPDRLYRDDALRRAFGRRSKVADAAVAYGDAWVVVEVTTAGFQLKTAAGVSEESLAQDIDDVIRKARQVDATVDNLRANESRLTDRSPNLKDGRGGGPGGSSGGSPGGRTFYPVVVVASRFAGNPFTFSMLRERLQREGLLQGPDIAPLEVLNLDDLLAMEGANERYGLGFLQMLEEKASSPGSPVPMLNFITDRLRRDAAPLPSRVEVAYEAWTRATKERLIRAKGRGDSGSGQ